MLHIHEFGPADGLPMLALHGVGGHGARWRRLAEHLPGVRIIGVDLRGHGRSSYLPPWSFEQHVTDAVEVLDELGLHQVPVLGHSFGGAIAVHLARHAPERVTRVILLDPAIGLDAADMLESAEEHRVPDSFLDPAAARADKAESWEGVAADAIHEEVDQHLICWEPGRWGWRYCPAAAVVAWSELARPAVTPPTGMPTLLVPATRADYVDPTWVADCRMALDGLLLVAPVDTGHMVQLARAAEVGELVATFLADPDG